MSDDATADRVRRLERRLERARAARAESERIAEDALRRLYEVNELKTVLLGTVNHELRTPATVIKGFAHHLVESWDQLDPDTRQSMVLRIAESAERLAALIEDVLGLVDLDATAVATQTEWLDPRTVIGQACLEVGDSHVVRQDLTDARLRASRPALKRIIDSLLDNAVAYAPPGTAIDVVCRSDGDHVELAVSDEGPGIPVAERTHVFEPFFRGAGDHVTRTSGLGVGLTVVRRLVSLHGGEIHVDGSTGGGTTFVVRLPSQPPLPTGRGPDE